jgi:hypothetical protein
MSLAKSEKDRLAVVLEHSKGDINCISNGIKKAISNVADEATRKHLWYVLSREARKALTPKRTKIGGGKKMQPQSDIEMMLLEDARKHEAYHLMRTQD